MIKSALFFSHVNFTTALWRWNLFKMEAVQVFLGTIIPTKIRVQDGF